MSDETSIPRDRVSMLRIIGVSSNLEDPSYFDLLSIPETATDAQLVQERVKERTTILRKYEQYRKDPAVQKLATTLMTQVSNAGRVLRDDARRAEYLKEMEKKRIDGFRGRLAQVVKPGQTVSEAQWEQFLALARQNGISERAAREIVAELARARHNQFAPLGVDLCEEDPAWPTAFEILGCDEAIEDDARIQEAAKERQTRLQSTSVSETDRGLLRRFVNEAALTLSSHDRREAYRESIAAKRRDRFVAAIDQVCHGGRELEQRTVMHLLQMARKMRLSTATARTIVMERTGFSDFGVDKPMLSVSPTQVSTGVLPDGTGCTHTLTVRNEGSGMLNVTFTPEVPWLRVEPASCQTEASHDVVMKILPEHLFPGRPETGAVRLEGNGGSASVTVRTRLGAGEISELEAWEVRMAKRAYQVCFAEIFLIVPGLVLVMLFMNHRNRSSYVAFHCMQAAFLYLSSLAVFLVIFGVFLEPASHQTSCLGSCVVPLVALFMLFGWQGIVIGYLDKDPFFVLPGIGSLAKKFL